MIKILNIAENCVVRETITENFDQILIAIDEGGELALTIAAPGQESQEINALIGREATFHLTIIDLDAESLVRNTKINMAGEESQCYISGVYIAKDYDRIENHISIRHQAPKCHSEQKFHGIVGGRSKVTFGGLIYVAKDAQQTIAIQENHNICLSDTAKVYSQPQLEIYADNVKCNHGATVGRRNEQAMFYMRQRGLSEPEAQALLLESFALAPLDEQVDEQIRESIVQMIHSL